MSASPLKTGSAFSRIIQRSFVETESRVKQVQRVSLLVGLRLILKMETFMSFGTITKTVGTKPVHSGSRLAPYVEDDSEITFHGEDDEWWGYRFENGELMDMKAAVVSIPCNADLETLKHNLVLGELTVEQATQILDILEQLQR